MEAPVDLTNLRSMTDGDKEMEKELFTEFYDCFESGLNVLRASCGDSDAETWRTQAHALKGVALNLGALHLGDLGKKAQDEYLVPEAAKVEMLKKMQTEYERVKIFLLNVNA